MTRGHELDRLIATTLGIPVHEVNDELEIYSVPSWDSRSHVELMAALPVRFGVDLHADRIAELSTVRAIRRAVLEGAATAYLEASGRSLTGYATLLGSRLAELMREGKPTEYPLPLATAWQLSFERLEEERPTAAALLRLCAFVSSDSIPASVIRANPRDLPEELKGTLTDDVEFDRVISVLRRYSLMELQGDWLRMHRLVQMMVRESLNSGQREVWQAAAERLSSSPYILPRHPTEIDRLDIQHYAVREALGRNYLAPVAQATRILDIGCGTGQWTYDLCREFPHALVIGLDLEPSKPEPPANYQFVQADLLEGMPFADDSFDFVHQRFMRVSIPVAAWPAVTQHLFRVTRSGGFVELVEFQHSMEPTGPETKRLWALFHQLADRRGLDGAGIVSLSLADYLLQAGAVRLRSQVVVLPVGVWGGTVGSMMATSFQAMFEGLHDLFQRVLGIEPNEYRKLLEIAMQECESYRSNAFCSIVYGRKP